MPHGAAYYDRLLRQVYASEIDYVLIRERRDAGNAEPEALTDMAAKLEHDEQTVASWRADLDAAGYLSSDLSVRAEVYATLESTAQSEITETQYKIVSLDPASESYATDASGLAATLAGQQSSLADVQRIRDGGSPWP